MKKIENMFYKILELMYIMFIYGDNCVGKQCVCSFIHADEGFFFSFFF